MTGALALADHVVLMLVVTLVAWHAL